MLEKALADLNGGHASAEEAHKVVQDSMGDVSMWTGRAKSRAKQEKADSRKVKQ